MAMNPLNMILQVMQAGNNPMQFLQNQAMQNPQMAQAFNIINGKSPAQLHTIAENMAKECGVDLNALAQSYGLKLPQ